MNRIERCHALGLRLWLRSRGGYELQSSTKSVNRLDGHAITSDDVLLILTSLEKKEPILSRLSYEEDLSFKAEIIPDDRLTLDEAVNKLQDVGFVVNRVRGEWKVTTKGGKTFSFATGTALVSMVKKLLVKR